MTQLALTPWHIVACPNAWRSQRDVVGVPLKDQAEWNKPRMQKALSPHLSGTNEESRSMLILLWTFALAAVAMCVTMVVELSPHGWLDPLWISSFLVVFTGAKVTLAQALF